MTASRGTLNQLSMWYPPFAKSATQEKNAKQISLWVQTPFSYFVKLFVLSLQEMTRDCEHFLQEPKSCQSAEKIFEMSNLIHDLDECAGSCGNI
jgi:hypothetical protein